VEAANATTRAERLAVILLCLLGAIHVFFFSAAFPFFSVNDEQTHFDLVVRYSQGDIPRSFTPVSDEALPFIAIYGTPEYLWPPATQTGGRIAPPPWKQPVAEARDQLMQKEAGYRAGFKNYEAASPPLYYLIAGGWWKLGKWIKLDGGHLLYWLRFLNVPLIVVLILLGWFSAGAVFPDKIFIRLAVPALIAFLPQTAFYSISNDMLTAITFGFAFLFLVKYWSAQKGALVIALFAGLAIAAAYLAKTTSLPLLIAAGCYLAFRFLSWVVNDDLPKSSVPFFLLLLTAALPIAAWMYWCKTSFGDLTGSSPKIQYLGWTVKPVSEWLHHPLFTGAGLWFFVKQNIATAWQGEMLWQRQPLANPNVDSAYVVLTLGALTLTLAAWLYPRSPFTTTQWPAIGFAFLCVLGSFAFFALLSVMYDFHDCFYPSKAHPFFVSGRLMLGMLIPFLILFACGLDRLMIRFQNITKFTLLLALLGFMIGSEITINGPILSNGYNWFHM
jgi:hypothetical protein